MVSSVTGKKKHFGILCSAREKCGNRTSEQAHKSEQWATEGKWKRVGQEQESSHWEKKKVFSHPGSLMIFFCVVQFHWQIHKANVTSDTSKMFHMNCHQLFYFLYNAAFFYTCFEHVFLVIFYTVAQITKSEYLRSWNWKSVLTFSLQRWLQMIQILNY